MEKKQQRLDEEELSWCSWKQEGLQMVLVDAARGGKIAGNNNSARTTQQQQQQHTQTHAADEDGVDTVSLTSSSPSCTFTLSVLYFEL